MAYQVLARKWRPTNFTQLVGQEHVSQSLIHALQHDRLHHAYLFTGTRGVGKTTIARILAKAMNCEQLQDCNPCGKCSVCHDFEQGRFMDLIEVDAASRTKVEDTRDLLDNAQYTPNQGRYKVYLIDEVHMLSGHSFNALLKTLEEPPPHVKFLLATTDPQKIPVTVLSRCLQFNLKRLLPAQIDSQLAFILKQEQINYETAALKFLAKAADGSMRDALSLLDQAIVYGNGDVSLVAVTGMLGTVAQQPVEDVLRALASWDARTLFAKIAHIAELTSNFAEILQHMLSILHRVALLQQLPDFVDDEFDSELLEDLAQALLPEDVQLLYQIGLIGQRDLELAPDSRTGFEMVMLRMVAFRPRQEAGSDRNSVPSANRRVEDNHGNLAQLPVCNSSVGQPAVSENWPEIIEALNLSGLSRELAINCVLDKLDDTECHLLLDPTFKQISRKAEDKLREALQSYLGKPVKLSFTVQESIQATPAIEMQKARENKQLHAVENIHSDKTVQGLIENFGGRIIPGSIEPLN